MRKQFVCYFWFVSFKSISLGLSLNISPLHVEIHLPFGFVKVGWEYGGGERPINYYDVRWRGFGLTRRYDA